MLSAKADDRQQRIVLVILLQPCVYLLNFNIAVTTDSKAPQAEESPDAANDEVMDDSAAAEVMDDSAVAEVMDDRAAAEVMDDSAAATPVAERTALKEDNKENSLAADLDVFPPTPTSVKPLVEFTVADTISMDTSAERKEDDISLIVHVDETANEFDDTISNVSGTSLTTSTRAQTPVNAAATDSLKDGVSVTPAATKSESKESVEVDIVLIADESIEDVSQRSDDTTATKDADAAATDSKNAQSNDKTASESEQEKTDKNETRLVFSRSPCSPPA